MSNSGTLLLSKVLDESNVQALALHNVKEDNFKAEADRKAYNFIKEYAQVNGGATPSYATVIENVPDFYYVTDVTDSYPWLVKQLRNDAGKVNVHDFLTKPNGISSLWEQYQNDIPTLVNKMQETLESIKQESDVQSKIGVSVKTDQDKFMAEYQRRKNGESFKSWKSTFSNIGEYTSGNMYVFYAKSGRGKSVIASVEEALTMAKQGANVLIWSMEMPWFEVLVRYYVALSGRKGITSINAGGIDLTGGFDSNDVRTGAMSESFELEFTNFLGTLNEELAGNITVRGVDDDDFNDRSLTQLEADILQTKADVVVVDPFYYLDYEKNTSGTTGGDAANTSKKLRRLTGKHSVVTIAITQAEETKQNVDEEGIRELELPEREAVKKTKSLLEDAAMLIAIDTDYKQGRGLIGINKGRNGGEGNVVEIIYLPQVGVVKEIEMGSNVAEQFGF